MEEKSTFWPSAMTYGLYVGVAIVLYSVVLYVFGQSMNTTLAMFSYVIIAAGILLSQIHYRNNQLNGYITYGRALGFGVAVMLFAGILQSLYTVILFKFIDPSLIDQMRLMQEEAMLKQGLNEEAIEAASQMMTKFQSPVILGISGLFSSALVGFIISLVTSIFVKKNDEENAFGEAMDELKKDEE